MVMNDSYGSWGVKINNNKKNKVQETPSYSMFIFCCTLKLWNDTMEGKGIQVYT